MHDTTEDFIATEAAYQRRIGVWWCRLMWLLCLLPGCSRFAVDLSAWLEERYPDDSPGHRDQDQTLPE